MKYAGFGIIGASHGLLSSLAGYGFGDWQHWVSLAVLMFGCVLIDTGSEKSK